MFMRLARTLILLTAAGVAYAGPIAACVCAVDAMNEMPCCPDDVPQQGQSPCAQPDAEMDAPCDAVPADLLPAGTHDLSPPIAISAARPLSWFAYGPPLSSIATASSHDSPPIYLITGRLRI